MGGLFGGGGGSVQAPSPPQPLKIKMGQLEKEMTAADQAAYGAADAYNTKYYPDLTKARDNMIGGAYKALTGPLDPGLQNTFMNVGNMGSLAAFGGGNPDAGMMFGGGGAGSSWGKNMKSMARNAAEASVATNVQGYQDYNRSLFQNLNTMFAPRAFGMTPEDSANIFTFNNTQYNNYLQQKFAADTNAYYQNAAAGAQQGSGIMSTITSVIGAAAAAY